VSRSLNTRDPARSGCQEPYSSAAVEASRVARGPRAGGGGSERPPHTIFETHLSRALRGWWHVLCLRRRWFRYCLKVPIGPDRTGKNQRAERGDGLMPTAMPACRAAPLRRREDKRVRESGTARAPSHVFRTALFSAYSSFSLAPPLALTPSRPRRALMVQRTRAAWRTGRRSKCDQEPSAAAPRRRHPFTSAPMAPSRSRKPTVSIASNPRRQQQHFVRMR
jgi:hypothetical protein